MPDADYWTPLLLGAPFLLFVVLVQTSGATVAAPAPANSELVVVVVEGGWSVHRDRVASPGTLGSGSTLVSAVGRGDGGDLRRAARDLLNHHPPTRIVLRGVDGVAADRVAWTAAQLEPLSPGSLVFEPSPS